MHESMSPEKRLIDYIDKQMVNQKRTIKVKTCADVYEHWRKYKRSYKKAPRDGVQFQIDYIDTQSALEPSKRNSAPVALALHGAPGSYNDFSLLIHHLTKQQVRVIAPNFPEYTATVRTKVLFRHSADEKAAYLRDFLKAINVTKIDLLVSHSSAIFPTLLILLNANKEAIQRRRELEAKRSEEKQQRRANNGHDETNSTKGRHQQQHQQQQHDATCESQCAKDEHQEAGAQLEQTKESVNNKYQITIVTSDDKQDDGTIDKLDIDRRSEHDSADESDFEHEEEEDNDGDELEDEEDVDEPASDDQVFEDASDLSECQHDDRNIAGRQVALMPIASIEANGEKQPPGTNEKVKQTNKKVKPMRGKRKRLDVVVKFDEPIEIKAVALFNPAGHRLPKSMKPTWFKCGSVPIYQHKLGRSLFRKLGPAFLTVVGVPVRVDNMDNVMLSASVMRNSKCPRVVEQLRQLSQMQIPTLLVFSENDKLIEREIFYEMTQFMSLDSNNFDVFNNDGDIELSQSPIKDWIRVMVFKAGGHYAYSNYAKTVNTAVSQLLNKVA